MDKQENYTEIAIKNISIILAIRNINVGDMEKYMGVSQGYFSRMKKNRNTNFDNIVKMAKFIDVSLDELIKTDCIDEIEKRFCK